MCDNWKICRNADFLIGGARMDIENASEKTRMRKEKIPARENSGTEIFFLISSERK